MSLTSAIMLKFDQPIPGYMLQYTSLRGQVTKTCHVSLRHYGNKYNKYKYLTINIYIYGG